MEKFLSVVLIIFLSVLNTNLLAQSDHEAYGDTLYVRSSKTEKDTIKLRPIRLTM